jgi:hypothetical protein
MSIKEQIQNSLNESGDNYKLKTNDELIDIIRDFGCGETEFHTADIERLIKENEEIKNLPPCLSCQNFYGECHISAGQQLHCINNKWSEFKKGDWKTKQIQKECTHEFVEQPYMGGGIDVYECKKCGATECV